MMTSRSEYRLLLRQDNADLRLTDIGYKIGLIGEERYLKFTKKREEIEKECERLNKTTVPPTEEVNALLYSLGSTRITTGAKLSELLRRPELSYAALAPIDKERGELEYGAALTAEILIKYEGYIKREAAEARKHKKLEERLIPEDIDYGKIRGLRLESAEKLAKIRPVSIGQASRISGVNPADISVLLIYLDQGC